MSRERFTVPTYVVRGKDLESHPETVNVLTRSGESVFGSTWRYQTGEVGRRSGGLGTRDLQGLLVEKGSVQTDLQEGVNRCLLKQNRKF